MPRSSHVLGSSLASVFAYLRKNQSQYPNNAFYFNQAVRPLSVSPLACVSLLSFPYYHLPSLFDHASFAVRLLLTPMCCRKRFFFFGESGPDVYGLCDRVVVVWSVSAL